MRLQFAEIILVKISFLYLANHRIINISPIYLRKILAQLEILLFAIKGSCVLYFDTLFLCVSHPWVSEGTEGIQVVASWK